MDQDLMDLLPVTIHLPQTDTFHLPAEPQTDTYHLPAEPQTDTYHLPVEPKTGPNQQKYLAPISDTSVSVEEKELGLAPIFQGLLYYVPVSMIKVSKETCFVCLFVFPLSSIIRGCTFRGLTHFLFVLGKTHIFFLVVGPLRV